MSLGTRRRKPRQLEPGIDPRMRAARIDDHVRIETSLAVRRLCGHAGRPVVRYAESAHAGPMQVLEAAALEHETAQQVLEHHPPAGEKGDIGVFGHDVRRFEGAARDIREMQFLRAACEQQRVEVRRVLLDEVVERRQQHVRVSRLARSDPSPRVPGRQVVRGHGCVVPLDAGDAEPGPGQGQGRAEGRDGTADDNGVGRTLAHG